MADGREAKPHERKARRTNTRDCSPLRTLTDVHEILCLPFNAILYVVVYVTLTGYLLCNGLHVWMH